MANTKEEIENNPFEIEDIEDARVIIQVKGKHYSIISTGDKEDAKAYRVALVQVLLSMEGMIIVTPSLEEIKVDQKQKAVDFLPILQENMQAQIAGYYNVDTTDEQRKIRNAVIEEYSDLISIYKSKL